MRSKAAESAIEGVEKIPLDDASTDSKDLENTHQKHTKV